MSYKATGLRCLYCEENHMFLYKYYRPYRPTTKTIAEIHCNKCKSTFILNVGTRREYDLFVARQAPNTEEK